MTVELEPITQASGLLSLFCIVLVFIITIVLFSAAIKQKDKIYFIFILFILAINSPWYPSGFGYLFWLITQETFTYNNYILLGTLGIPVAGIAWLYFYTTLFKPMWKTKIIIIILIYSLVYYIYIFCFLGFGIQDVKNEWVGELESPLDINYNGFVLFYIATVLGSAAPTFLHFCMSSIKTKEDPIIQWRGRLLIVALVSFMVGAIVDGLFHITDLTLLIIIRGFVLTSAISFYLGLVMPAWFKKLIKLEVKQLEK